MSETEDLELTDGDVVLRRWSLDDAPAVHDACQDPLIQRFIPVPRPYTEEVARSWVERARSFWGDNQERAFAIVDAQTRRLLGSVTRHGPYGHRATFGYWLAPEARGRGAATRALRLITDWTLQTSNAVRLDLYTMVDNDASMRVAERVGYQREALLRAWDIDGEGRPVDVVYYAQIREPKDDAVPGR